MNKQDSVDSTASTKQGEKTSLVELVTLRAVKEDDLLAFFEMQLTPEANHMAAFTAKDPSDKDAFMLHWNKILKDDTIIKRTIEFKGQVTGNIASFMRQDERELCYWLKQNHWGKGIATEAVAQFLKLLTNRPLFARAAKDNIGSLKVLEKSGFSICGYDRGFSNSRGEEVDEVVFSL